MCGPKESRCPRHVSTMVQSRLDGMPGLLPSLGLSSLPYRSGWATPGSLLLGPRRFCHFKTLMSKSLTILFLLF